MLSLYPNLYFDIPFASFPSAVTATVVAPTSPKLKLILGSVLSIFISNVLLSADTVSFSSISYAIISFIPSVCIVISFVNTCSFIYVVPPSIEYLIPLAPEFPLVPAVIRINTSFKYQLLSPFGLIGDIAMIVGATNAPFVVTVSLIVASFPAWSFAIISM